MRIQMIRHAITLAALALLLVRPATPAHAQTKPASVGGSWQVSMEGQGNGPAVKQTLAIVEQRAARSVGRSRRPRATRFTFHGTVKGANIAFSLIRKTPDGDVTQQFAGTVAGDSITGTVTQGQFHVGWMAARSKQQAAAL